MEVYVEIGTKFGKGKKCLYGVKLNNFFIKNEEFIDYISISSNAQYLDVKLNNGYLFSNDCDFKFYLEGKVLEQAEKDFLNIKKIEVVENVIQEDLINEDFRSNVSEKRFRVNELVSMLGFKIRNCESNELLNKYEDMLNVIEEILLTENIKVVTNVSANIKAKLDNKEKRKEEFIKKFEEAKENLRKNSPFWKKIGLNEILKEAGLNKQTFYNYKLNEIYKF